MEYINSSGIAIVIQVCWKHRKVDSRSIGIFGLSAHFQKVFTMVGITKYAALYPDEQHRSPYCEDNMNVNSRISFVLWVVPDRVLRDCVCAPRSTAPLFTAKGLGRAPWIYPVRGNFIWATTPRGLAQSWRRHRSGRLGGDHRGPSLGVSKDFRPM